MSRTRLTALAGAACLLAVTVPATAAPTSSGWLTPELVAAAHAAGPTGAPLPAAALAELPASVFAFTGIRPGTLITVTRIAGRTVETGEFCTANFVFQTTAGTFDPAQQLYLGTAGHCVDTPGAVVSAVTAAPGSGRYVLVEIGRTVLDIDTADDLALIEIDPALNAWVSPSMAHWGGPVGVYTGGADVVTFVGHFGTVGGAAPRTGNLRTFNSMTMEFDRAPGGNGDSGGPVTTIDGLAVGHISSMDSLVPGNTGIAVGHHHFGPSITRILSLVGKPLATCPTRTPWTLAGCPPV